MRIHSTLLLGALLLTMPATGAEKNTAQPLRIAAQTLVMQPGDAEAFARGLDRPMPFIQIQASREFSGSLLVRAKPGHTPAASARVAPLVSATSHYVEEYVLTVPNTMSESELASMLMATGDYEFAQPNWILYPATVPNDPRFSSSWQHTRIQSAAAWDLSTGDSSVIVAVCDSGVDLDHPDLQNLLVPGYNAANRQEQIDGGLVDDINGHGTFVSGCAAAQGNNNQGVVGVGWGFSIMPIRVTNNTNGTASPFSIAEGARWAADHGAHVVNVSFSGATSPINVTLAQDLKAMGALLFYAAGNDNANISPNRPDFVIVASTTSSDRKSSFSNHGTAVSVAAPGSSVSSTRRGGGYGNGSGTSYASPIAAGVGAMIFSVNPDFGPDDVQEILYTSVDDLGAPGRDSSFGFGRVNTHNAILVAQNYAPRTLLPLTESFESASWTNLFTTITGSPSTIFDPDAPDGASMLQMSETDTIESTLLAGRLSLGNNYQISMMVNAQGVEASESIEIQFRDANDAWVSLVTMTSLGVDTDAPVRIHSPTLDFNFAYHGVTIRVLAHGSDATDVWLIDDLRIEPAPPPITLPFTDSFNSGILDSNQWDLTQTTASIGATNQTIALEISADVQAETIDLNTRDLSTTGGFINFFALTDDIINDDALTIEYFSLHGTWLVLDTIDASSLNATPRGFSYEIPLLGFTETFRLRISDTSADGGFFVDDLSIGVDPLTIGCPADFTADGTLDIFDVLAFLDAFNAGDPAADFTGDSSFDIFDVLAFLDSFNAGCP